MPHYTRLRRALHLDAQQWLLGGTSLLVIYLVLIPLLFLVVGSFFTPTAGGTPGSGDFTLENYTRVYADPALYRMMGNSAYYAFGAAVLAVCFATAVAWLVERTNLPGRTLFYALTTGSLVIPGMLNAMAWSFLLSPKIGLVNRLFMDWFGLQQPPFNVYTIYGMMWAEGTHLWPLAFFMIATAFTAMDPALEEAARVTGANQATTFYQVTLKLIRPALYASFLITFVRAFQSFEVPALLGLRSNIHVFTSQIYIALKMYPTNFGLAGSLAVILLVTTALGVFLYTRMIGHGERYSTITGKGYRPAVIDLGPWRWPAVGLLVGFFCVVLGLPLFILAWGSVIPYFAIPSRELLARFTWSNYKFLLEYPLVLKAFKNTVILSFGTATLTMLLAAIIAWLVLRTRLRGRWLLDALASLPLAVPSMILGVSLIWLYLRVPIPLYGTIWILVVAYITMTLPFGIRYASTAMVQIHRELEEAGMVSGATWPVMFRRILVPLLTPGLLAGWIYIVTVTFRELGAAVLLYTSGTEVLSVVMFDWWEGGQVTKVAAIGIFMVISLTVLTYVSQVLRRRYGVRVGN